MAALDFPNPPLTVGQTWGGTNGVTYTWDGAVWTATAASGGGGGGGGAPTGPAGGDLTGTYPNPTIGPLAVGNAEISDVAYSKVTGAPTIPTTLPPSGSAGGDLTGTYPNPTVGPLAVGNAEISDLAYSKLTGAPTSLPPSGAAGGALTGTYPNPGVSYAAITGTPTSLPPSGAASGDLSGTYPGPTVTKVNGQTLTAGDIYYVNATPAITRLAANSTATNQYLRSVSSGVPSWQPVAYADVSGTPSALPPSGAAGGDLQGTYPNPTIKPASLPWTPSGATLTPTDATKRVVIPGPTAASVDQSQLVLGTRTGKAHLEAPATYDMLAIGHNRYYDGAAWQRDDVSKAAWTMMFDITGDTLSVTHVTAANVAVSLLTLDNAGNLTINGATATKASGTTWANPSDRRLKEDIMDYPTGLEAIRALRPRTFVYNGKGGSSAGTRGYGYIADEAAAVMPELLGTRRAKLAAEDEDETDIQMLDTSNVTLALVNAVKELEARLRAVEAR